MKESLINLLNDADKKLGKVLTFNKGETIFNEGDMCANVCIILNGEIVITSFTNNGKQIVYNHLADGGMFGNNLIFSSNPIYKGDVIALKDTSLLMFNKNSIISILKSNEIFLCAFLNIQSEFGIALNYKIKILSFDKSIDRLDYLFSVNNNEIKFSSITNLANELFLSREAVSRLINKLIKENKIKKINHKIIKI